MLACLLLTLSDCTGTPPKTAARWEHHVLAEGVELHVREDAPPDARETAERVEREYRSQYASAR